MNAPDRRKSVFTYVGVAALVVVGVAWAILVVMAHRAVPMLRERITADLDARFGGSSTIGDLQVSVFPRIRGAAENLIIRREGQSGAFIAIRHLDLIAGLWDLIRRPTHVASVHLQGLTITIPPRGSTPPLQQKGADHKRPLFVIDRVVCDDGHLTILNDKPGKLPLNFDIYSVRMRSAGPEQAMPFTARLTNPKPEGYIETKGEFGPWKTDEPRDTPVSGSYTFDHADLSTIHGIGGILSSRGRFNGVLDRIEVDGETDTPDFRVSTADHPVPLHTEFSATVDGTSGDTYLHPVRATLVRSVLIANGSVVRTSEGHQVKLDVTSTEARIEDLLKVAVRTDTPALTGPAALQTQVVLLPGAEPVPDRLDLDGSFTLPAAHFSNLTVETKLDELSLRARGRPQEANEESEEQSPSDVASEMRGKFKLMDGTISLSELRFMVPGASITLSGNYRLDDRQFSFEGQARMEAKLSQMTTGLKSLLLKAADPIFDKNGAGTVLPIRIYGTGTSPKVTLDLGHARRAK